MNIRPDHGPEVDDLPGPVGLGPPGEAFDLDAEREPGIAGEPESPARERRAAHQVEEVDEAVQRAAEDAERGEVLMLDGRRMIPAIDEGLEAFRKQDRIQRDGGDRR